MKRSFSKHSRCIGLAVGAALVIGAAIQSAAAQQEDILQQVLRTHVLTIGTISSNPDANSPAPTVSLTGMISPLPSSFQRI